MNNPPDIAQDPAEHEEYAHGVHQHVARYLMVGATLLLSSPCLPSRSPTSILAGSFLAVSRSHFAGNSGGRLNIAVAMLVATFKAGLVALIFMHLAAEKRLIYRVLIFTGFFVLGLFWLTYLAWYDYPIFSLNVTQSFPYRFHHFLDAARARRRRLVHLGQSRRRRAGLSRRRDRFLRLRAWR